MNCLYELSRVYSGLNNGGPYELDDIMKLAPYILLGLAVVGPFVINLIMKPDSKLLDLKLEALRRRNR